MRSAIATGDRQGALRLLRAHVEGEVDLSTVPAAVADELIQTACGVDHTEQPDSAVIGRARVQGVRDRVIQLLAQTPFTNADLAEIRQMLESLEDRARQAEERALREELRVSVRITANSYIWNG